MRRQRSSGRVSPTYEISQVWVDEQQLTISALAAHRTERVTVDLSDLAHIPLAQQMFRVLASAAQPLRSWITVENTAYVLRNLVDECGKRGITDAHDERFTVELATELTKPGNAHHLLMAAVEERPDRAVFNSLRQPTPRGDSVAFSDAEIADLKATAIAYLDAIEEVHLTLDPHSDMEAAGVVAAAEERDGRRPDCDRVTGRATPDWGWDDAQFIDWLLLHPDVANINSVPPRHAPGEVRERYLKLFRAIYPDNRTFAAFGVLIMLSGNDGCGYNPSTWISYGVNHLVRLGDNFGQVKSAKARSQREFRKGVNFNSKHGSLGGLLQLADTLTRFTRAHHTAQIAHATASGQDINEAIGDAFFVTKQRGLPTGIVVDSELRRGALELFGLESFEFVRIRLWVVRQQVKSSPRGTLDDHTTETRDRVYMPRALDHDLALDMAVTARDEMENPDARVLSGCVTNVTTNDGTPCRLGIAACFTCPSGFRSEVHAGALSVVPEVVDAFVQHTSADSADAHEALTLKHLVERQLNEFTKVPKVSDRERQRLRLVISHLITARKKESGS